MIGVRVEEPDHVEPRGPRLLLGGQELLRRDQVPVVARVLAAVLERDRALDLARPAEVPAHQHAAALLGIGAAQLGVDLHGQARAQPQAHAPSPHSGSSR